MKFLIVFSDTVYFRWQILVQYNNLKKFGYDKDIVFVCSYDPKRGVSKELKELESIIGIKIFKYPDNRKKNIYTSSIRLHVLSQYFSKNHKNIPYFYIDPDVLFIDYIDFDSMLKDDVWYVSNTASYLNSRYINSKSPKLFDIMCNIVGIDKKKVKDNDKNAGGAQYLLKNINDSNFWHKVEKDAVLLYKIMNQTSNIFHPEHPIQAWTADMWSLLWNGWLYGNKIKIIPELDFCWATDNISRWEQNKIFHNAGVFNQDFLFNKMHFMNKEPFNKDFSYVDKKYCSSKYVEEIIETKKNFNLL